MAHFRAQNRRIFKVLGVGTNPEGISHSDEVSCRING